MKYQFTIDKIDLDTTHGKVLHQIRPGSSVLECGCATGYITRFMKEQLECKVHIIEYEQDAFDIASQYAESGICADLMQDSWVKEFEGMQFDYILFMDVLEHLMDPKKVLMQAEKLLKKDGTVLVTLPNIAHNDIIINLYNNAFNYLERGILDNTHIKFFGRNNLNSLLEDTGLQMTRLEYSLVKTGRSEQFWETECRVSEALLKALANRDGGDIYQFVISAKKTAYCLDKNIKLSVVDTESKSYDELIGIQDVYNQYVKTQEALDARDRDIQIIQNSVQQTEERYALVNAELKRSEESVHKLLDHNLEITRRFEQCSEELLQSKDEIRNLEKDNLQRKKQIEAFQIQIQELQKQNNELGAQNERANTALQNSETMVRRLRDNYISMEQLHHQIINSRGYRLLNLYYRIRVALIPNGSLRYKVVKAIVKPFLTLYRKLRGAPKPVVMPQFAPVSGEASVAGNKAVADAPRFLDIDQGFELLRNCNRIDIISVQHTAYVARLLQGILWDAGLECNLYLQEPEQFENIPYIMICPQNFKHFPPLYIAYQMEQTINSRWLTEEYMEILHNAYAILDYSLENINFFSNDPTLASKLFYLPVDVCEDMLKGNEQNQEKEYDILFYGSPYIDRRQEFLQKIGEKHDLRIICDKFGPALYEEMRKAKLVINVHYYQDALLETTRLYETLSASDCLIVSERSGDPVEEERLEDIVDFTEVSNVDAMVERIDYWLANDAQRERKTAENMKLLKERANATKFYLYRFLLAYDCVTFDQFYEAVNDFIHFDNDRICLSLPESITRKNAFIEDNKYGFKFFPGLKHRAGWIGCGMSYKFMLRKAKDQNMDQITICEDDVYFPPDFDERFAHVQEYIANHQDWSVFSGIMADLGRVKPLSYEENLGEEFIYLDKMISMVFNIYDKSVFELIASWDNMNRNVNTNTVDRYLEDKQLRVLTTCPFLVGHKEDLCSTIWGQQNTIYTQLIENSSIKLREIVESFKKNMPKK